MFFWEKIKNARKTTSQRDSNRPKVAEMGTDRTLRICRTVVFTRKGPEKLLASLSSLPGDRS
jgi:hypothetical protein